MRAAFSLVVLKQPHWVLDISLLFAGSFPGGRFSLVGYSLASFWEF